MKVPELGSVREFRNYGRNSFRVSKDLQLNISRIRFESPGLIEFMTAVSLGAGSLWILLQALERITSWQMNREKLRLEIEKLRRDLGRPPQSPRLARLEPYLMHPETESAIRHLDTNPLKPVDVQVLRGSGDRRDRQ
jgi:hypothetical protein